MRTGPSRLIDASLEQELLAAIAEKKARVVVTKREYEKAKLEFDRIEAHLKKLQDAVDGIRLETGAKLGVDRNRGGRRARAGKGHRSNGVRPESSKPGEETHGDGPSMASIIKKVVFAQSARYTSQTISAQMESDYPKTFVRLPQGYITTLLWKLNNSRKIRLLDDRDGDNLNVYENLKK